MKKITKHLILSQLFFILLIVFIISFFYASFRGDEKIIFDDLKFKIFDLEEKKVYLHNDSYPVIFVHGHSPKEKELIKNSLSAFSRYQIEMDRDGYYEGYGIVYPGEKKELSDNANWQNTSLPVSVRMTYYVDLEDENFNRSLVVKNFEEKNISVYAQRLSKVIETIKFRTGAKKVNIVAHSMGGLVSREYLRLYGDESVDKFIMVGTPNKGVSGIVTTRLCNFANPGIECLQMRTGSDFLNELNKKNLSDYQIDAMTVAGSCCKFCPLCNGRDFTDEVVITRNVELVGAKNLIINGTKGETDSMHSELINPYIYPEVYEEVIKFLKD